MRNTQTEDRFNALLEQIKTRFRLLTEPSNNHSSLDIDVLRDQIRELYQCLDALSSTVDESKEEMETPSAVTQIEEEMPIETVKEMENIEPIEEIEIIEDPVDDRLETFVEEQKKPSVLENEIEIEDDSIHSKLTEQYSAPTVVDKINVRPEGKLSKAIGLNDKFQLLGNLFNGEESNYTECIQMLEQQKDFDSAEDFLKNVMAIKYSWDIESETYCKLLEITSRYFS